MRHTLIISALGTLLHGAAIAQHDPSLDRVVEFDSFTAISAANGGSPVVYAIPPWGTSDELIVGFSFSGHVFGITGSTSWASDLQMIITAPSGAFLRVGGFTSPRDIDWDFQGIVSDNNGAYESGPHYFPGPPIPKGGLGGWTVSFANDWNNAAAANMHWSNVQITIHKIIPAPGAAAMFGVVGLSALRRRR